MAGIFSSDRTHIVSSEAHKAEATGITKSSTTALLNHFLNSFHPQELYTSSQASSTVGVLAAFLPVNDLGREMFGLNLIAAFWLQTISHLLLYTGTHSSTTSS